LCCLCSLRIKRTSISEINLHVNLCSEKQSRKFGRSKKKLTNPLSHSLADRIPTPSQSHATYVKSTKKSQYNLKNETIRLSLLRTSSSPTSILEIQLPTGLASNEQCAILDAEKQRTAKVGVPHHKHKSQSTTNPIRRKTPFPPELERMLKDILVQRMLLEDST
jgi:hypothetical protein